MIFCANMSEIKIMRRSVFIQFWYREFNGVICFKWVPMHAHQLSSFQYWSMCFLWLSITVIVTWWLFVPAWVTLKLSKGVFSYNFGMETLMVQSVFNEHQCMFINFHLFSVDQCVSLIFYESYSYLMIFCASMSDIKIMKRSVFIQFRYCAFNNAICF